MSLSKNIFVRLHRKNHEEIEKIAKKNNLKKSYIVRELIREYFEQKGKKKLF